ncbi:phosphate transport system regulatory protein PhoU [candidate division WOR-1 bacterium RIFOXYA12_FULL_43_27]|uniref:Phosphate-specific transport system accessory protein PhoU n=1 Tax=candidate division WOR-1 bacterium RIFOXYC2_FULL_46_14 TaxID=1802587 RepID=A0A1F4U4V0_UNCSA|nr:MAG: phosphate transport system regulatory protein PhoU [candidate division WOR-1 bacterium RIFOXYA12_FULL_43_27]OGC20673.1 MAG: phosphate transport system regulatory protein PhoU [candidate division WOR-1 bacterium RIFOXYB2_FULL_46_45]OGC31590.1 MAG: phosphate transport system regulatory protein PhoU [candidate division WOR-1 bacterium RIFOXYA2_FULL_46_56]OGC39995.1 MAG: phosphate transport system regulatory protein PhoU [candidate division WOR-1 bacterium RIFOXYC2_FULL_46_14]
MIERIFDHELAELSDLILKMGVMVQGLIRKSVEALKNQDTKLAQAVIEEDEHVDQMELEIDEKSIQLIALRQPEASDLRFLTTGMRIATDLERIGDLAEDIAERTVDLSSEPLLKPLVDIPKMAKLAEEGVAAALDAFVKRDSSALESVWDKEKEVDRLRDAVQLELTEIMGKDAKTVSRALPLLLVSRHLERISDHATNIAEDVTYMVEGKVVKHLGRPKT